MDQSALTDAQQLQQQYQQYLREQEQQQQQQPPYDPAQSQAYEAYYAYQQQQQQKYDASAYQNHQYYPHDYSSAAYYPPQPPAQSDPAPQPALAPHDPSQIHAPQHHAVAAAAAQGHGYAPTSAQEQQGPAPQVPPGLNPAAAAAVSALLQLTQFAGTMDAAERAMAGRQWHAKDGVMMEPMAGGIPQPLPPQHNNPYPHESHHHYGHHPIHDGVGSGRYRDGGRSQYRGGGGGGRRGGGTFRGGGGGRGNFGHRPPHRQDRDPLPLRGRGRGEMGSGGGRQFHQLDPDTQSPHTAPGVLPPVPVLPIAWCDICRVECNSFEILEQHKNGKRHKKTVKTFEQRQAQQRLIAELQAKGIVKPEMALATVGGINAAQVGEPIKTSTASGTVPTPVFMTEYKMEPVMQSQNVEVQSDPRMAETSMEAPPAEVAASDVPGDEGHARRPRMNVFDQRRGQKRKMVRFGRGGKRLQYFEMVDRPVERPREHPMYCTLCNVMCDTAAVFDIHLSGKKHISRIRRFHGQGAVYGPISVYIPPDQPTPSKGPEPLFYGLQSHEMLQQEAYGPPNVLQAGSFGQASEAEGPALGFPTDQGSEHPIGEVLPANGEQEAVNLGSEGQNAVMEFESKDTAAFLISEDAIPST